MPIKVPQMAWYGDTEMELDFPPAWEVDVYRMAGENVPKLSQEEMNAAFLHPIGTKRIWELAKGKKEVVILFDDLARPTKAAELVPYVLQELKQGGIKDENIRFIAAVGSHAAMNFSDFAKKLGHNVVERYQVYNHNPYENCIYLGKTTYGTPISVNKEVMACDLKIAIGAIVPHPRPGFGGGGKAILPGVCHIDTIEVNHRSVAVAATSDLLHNGVIGKIDSHGGWGNVDANISRLDIEEATRMAGLDVIVNAVVNLHRDTVGLFVGDPIAAHRKGVQFGRKIYITNEPRQKADVVVANGYSKANEIGMSLNVAHKFLKAKGGDIILIASFPQGMVVHYLFGRFGKKMGGRLWRPVTKLPPRTKRVIVLGDYISHTGLAGFGLPSLVTRAHSWKEALSLLERSYDHARVAVIPDGTIQLFPNA